MDKESCPLPAVAVALDPYIKTREQVGSIRQALHTHLQGDLQTDSSGTEYLNISDARLHTRNSGSTGLSGIHRAYLDALRAHNTAQAKCDALKADLERLRYESPDSDTVPENLNANKVHEYLPVARQREKQRRLKVIDRAVSKMNAAATSISSTNLDDIVKSEIGELPGPPSNHGPLIGGPSFETDVKILALKKDIVSTKRKLGKYGKSQSSEDAKDRPAFTTQAEITGLQNALNELTVWMENQLAIIAETSAETQGTNGALPSSLEPETPGKSSKGDLDELTELYEDYLSARERLIDLAKPPTKQTSAIETDLAELFQEHKEATENSAVKSPVEALLPHLSILVQNKRDEQASLQQLAHVRQRITASEEHAGDAMRRLADESHLVLPGAHRAMDWASSAKKSSAATYELVESKAAVGNEAAVHAAEALGRIEGLSEQLDRLVETRTR